MTTRYNWQTASKGSIGVSGVRLVDDYEDSDGINYRAYRPSFGVQIYADANNSQSILVGKSDITAATGSMTDGYPLAAGDSILIPARRVDEIYVVAANGATDLVANYVII